MTQDLILGIEFDLSMIVLLVEVWFMGFFVTYDDGAMGRVYLKLCCTHYVGV